MTVNLTPQQRYQSDLKKEGFVYDPSQEHAVGHLQDLYDRLVAAWSASQNRGVMSRFLTTLGRRPNGINVQQGLYFWGGVGRGKTYLMDNFYESLPFDAKLRAHFHRFMRRVHAELNQLNGERDPLEKVADRIAAEAQVLCFDEFFVSDITDAMILGKLLELLFRRGVVLVATSNIVPDGLYENGLQRQRFLPAIALLNTHTRVVNVDGGVDYRLRALTRAEIYLWPLDNKAESALKAAFDDLVPTTDEVVEGERLEIEGRIIATRYIAEDVVWFDFLSICDGPRSQNDYIELAREFHAVLISNVPRFNRDTDDQARRFVNMVDEFYDRGVKLLLTAAAPLAELYVGGNLAFEFKRTVSRLLEMQSHEYLARPHRA